MLQLAIDIGGTKTAAAVMAGGQVRKYITWPSPPHASEALDLIIARCTPLTVDVSTCGVAFGGVFNFSKQISVRSMHVSGWEDIEVSKVIEDALGIPVLTDNDANVAALGEHAKLKGNYDPFVYVTISTGVGAAIVVNDRLVRGAHNMAGELGHLFLRHDKACKCGQVGCFERAVSGYWLEADHGLPAADVLADPERHRQWVAEIASGIWSAFMVLDPALIVIAGGMSRQGKRLLNPLTLALTHKANQAKRTPPVLRLGDPTGRTVLVGAAMLAREAEHGAR